MIIIIIKIKISFFNSIKFIFKFIKLKIKLKCYEIWEMLKNKLYNISILIFSNFNRFFILYINENKKKEYKIAFYQIEVNEIKRFILFLSRNFNNVKI